MAVFTLYQILDHLFMWFLKMSFHSFLVSMCSSKKLGFIVASWKVMFGLQQFYSDVLRCNLLFIYPAWSSECSLNLWFSLLETWNITSASVFFSSHSVTLIYRLILLTFPDNVLMNFSMFSVSFTSHALLSKFSIFQVGNLLLHISVKFLILISCSFSLWTFILASFDGLWFWARIHYLVI